MRTAFVALAALVPAIVVAQGDNQAKITSALSAGPMAITSTAAIQDWDGTVLRPGTSSWICLPDMVQTPQHDPMCLDGPWMTWVHAFMSGTAPSIDRIGFGYMLSASGAESNTDPAATGPTATNEWLTDGGAHVMMVVPNATMLRGLPTHPSQADGGPWVMWRDTPYVHVMIPLPTRPARGRP
ncbi:MAG: hypothetical protein WD934_11815 [Gemmatimonadales bacterium]